jgi:hypothetical protein
LNGNGSSLTTTLEKHVGPDSPLLQMLSPDQRKGILAALDLVLQEHSKSIVHQFSLDDKDSALSRLVCEITEKNGGLRQELASDLESIRKEFSLDNDQGALSRLVGRVERANRTILNEFSADNELSALNRMAKLLESTNKNIDASLSLDQEKSPLARLRREILTVIEGMSKANAAFQEQVRVSLESLKVRREEAARSTVHGLDFQQVVGAFVQQQAQRLGDMFESTGDTAGNISRCKVGDFVTTLGHESAAPDSRIVFEAKEDQSYSLKDALVELKTARENRQAQVGVFVFSSESAPEEPVELTDDWRSFVAPLERDEPLSTELFNTVICWIDQSPPSIDPSRVVDDVLAASPQLQMKLLAHGVSKETSNFVISQILRFVLQKDENCTWIQKYSKDGKLRFVSK